MAWPDPDGPALFTRVSLTRALCISVYGGWIVLLALALSLVIVPALTPIDSITMFATLLPYGLALYAWWFIGRAIMRGWRRCDRCREPLFAEPGWIRKTSAHHGAKTLGGSYVNATAWEYIKGGVARCMWCGHRDGDTPDYVVRK